MAVGPEVLYMVGPGSDRDLFVLGVARVGILPFTRRVAPEFTLGWEPHLRFSVNVGVRLP